MALTNKGSIFGLEAVYIKAPNGTDTWVQIPYVQSAAYKGSVTELELTGDNQIQAYLYHSAKGQIVVKASQAAMAVFEKLSGNTGSVFSTSVDTLLFGTTAELTPQILAVKAVMPIVKADGTKGKLTTYWFKANVQTAFESFPGANYGAVSEVTFTFNAVRSEKDENGATVKDAGGNALAGGAFGRIEMS